MLEVVERYLPGHEAFKNIKLQNLTIYYALNAEMKIKYLPTYLTGNLFSLLDCKLIKINGHWARPLAWLVSTVYTSDVVGS